MKNTFGFTNQAWYGASDVYYIHDNLNFKIDLKYLLAILNSKLIYFWLYNKGQRKGETLQLFKDPLSEIPIVISDKKKKIVSIVEQIISTKKNEGDITKLEGDIDNLVYRLYELSFDEVKEIDPYFDLSKTDYDKITLE